MSLTLLADEGLDLPIVQQLRRAGYEVLYVMEMEPGISDEVILAQAERLGALLITADKDFGELVFRQGKITRGVLLVRLAGLPPPVKADLVVTAVLEHEPELLGAFSVISPGVLRVRKSL